MGKFSCEIKPFASLLSRIVILNLERNITYKHVRLLAILLNQELVQGFRSNWRTLRHNER